MLTFPTDAAKLNENSPTSHSLGDSIYKPYICACVCIYVCVYTHDMGLVIREYRELSETQCKGDSPVFKNEQKI